MYIFLHLCIGAPHAITPSNPLEIISTGKRLLSKGSSSLKGLCVLVSESFMEQSEGMYMHVYVCVCLCVYSYTCLCMYSYICVLVSEPFMEQAEGIYIYLRVNAFNYLLKFIVNIHIFIFTYEYT
jgi:hypothetical protein